MINPQRIETEHFIVHIREENNELKIFANKKVGDKEGLPLAYLLGTNALICKINRDKK